MTLKCRKDQLHCWILWKLWQADRKQYTRWFNIEIYKNMSEYVVMAKVRHFSVFLVFYLELQMSSKHFMHCKEYVRFRKKDFTRNVTNTRYVKNMSTTCECSVVATFGSVNRQTCLSLAYNDSVNCHNNQVQ